MQFTNAQAWSHALKQHGETIKEDLKNRQKQNHWIWYVFPSDREGQRDQHRPKVKIQRQADFDQFVGQDQFRFWVEIVRTLSQKPGYFTSPQDIGRIGFSAPKLLEYIDGSGFLDDTEKAEYKHYITNVQGFAVSGSAAVPSAPRGGGGPRPKQRSSAPKAGGGGKSVSRKKAFEILPENTERTLAVLAGVKEAYLAALEACSARGQTHLVCCMVSGGIYADDYVHDALFSTGFGYATILDEIFTEHSELNGVKCVLANFIPRGASSGRLSEMKVPQSARTNVSIMEGDSITVACKILERVPSANVCIMIAGNAGRPFGALGKMDRSGLEDGVTRNLSRKYGTQEESVLINFLKTGNELPTRTGGPDALYNYYINGVKGASFGATPEPMLRTLVTAGANGEVHIGPHEGLSPWGMDDISATSTKTMTVQGFDYTRFNAMQYHFCLLTEDCLVRDPRAREPFTHPAEGVQKVSFAFVFGPNIRSTGTATGAQSRTLVKHFGGAGGGTRGQFSSLQVV